jgi:hypothetical protein
MRGAAYHLKTALGCPNKPGHLQVHHKMLWSTLYRHLYRLLWFLVIQ